MSSTRREAQPICPLAQSMLLASRGSCGWSEEQHRLGKLVRFRLSEIECWLALHHQGSALLRGRAMPSNSDQLSLFPTGGKNGE